MYSVCKQLFLCDVSRSHEKYIDTLFMSFSLYYKRLEEKGNEQSIKGKPWHSG